VYFIYKNEVGLLLALSMKVPIFTRNLLIHKAFGLKRLTQIIAVLSGFGDHVVTLSTRVLMYIFSLGQHSCFLLLLAQHQQYNSCLVP
jgi:hypothetical protein